MLWITGASKADLREMVLPRLLALPTFVTELLEKQGGTCLLHKLINFVVEHIKGGESQVPAAKMGTRP